jgi:type IV pilus assembly protein PilW
MSFQSKILAHGKGFTLVEFLVAMTVSLMILGGIYTLVIQNSQVSVGQSNIVEMQQNARIALDFMTREIMMGGYDPLNNSSFYLNMPIILLDPPSNVASGWQPNRIRVLADLNHDGDTQDSDEDITYEYDPARQEITRDAGNGASVIADHIINFAMTFDPAATVLLSGAGPGATTVSVFSAAGFEIGDQIYVSDGVNLCNTFITDISGSNLSINPSLTDTFNPLDTVAHVRKVRFDLTVETGRRDPQTGRFRTIDLTSDVHLRNFAN